MALDRSAPRTRPEDLPAGPRRLKRILKGQVVYYPTMAAARRAWIDICAKAMSTSEEHAQASVKVEYRESDEGWVISGRYHPAKYHWSRVLEHVGAMYRQADYGEEWYKIPARTEEEIAEIMMNRSNLGRYWP